MEINVSESQIKNEFLQLAGKDTETTQWLIDNGLISVKTMRDFLICKNYDMLIRKTSITDAIFQLNEKFQVSERQIRNIYYYNLKRFNI
jgi:hypothetical protein